MKWGSKLYFCYFSGSNPFGRKRPFVLQILAELPATPPHIKTPPSTRAARRFVNQQLSSRDGSYSSRFKISCQRQISLNSPFLLLLRFCYPKPKSRKIRPEKRPSRMKVSLACIIHEAQGFVNKHLQQ